MRGMRSFHRGENCAGLETGLGLVIKTEATLRVAGGGPRWRVAGEAALGVFFVLGSLFFATVSR